MRIYIHRFAAAAFRFSMFLHVGSTNLSHLFYPHRQKVLKMLKSH